jgi:hypothetical protein
MRLSEQYVKVRYTRGQVCLISNVCWPEKLHVEKVVTRQALFCQKTVSLTGSSNRLR